MYEENKYFRILIFGDNEKKLLIRILIILEKRNLQITFIQVKYTTTYIVDDNNNNIGQLIMIDLECLEEQLKKIIKLIRNLIGIIHIDIKINSKKSWKLVNIPLIIY
ncbi:acetolactate synthase [Blattabacterium cuenoti]|uniref:acetolactate synthase n=1 Tax=Blattabacterium cuenoti TaxID=1653831 RepID=UPI00163CBB46|nr:acetolactate synthase [Blattabacterium cuenoti]